MAHTQRMNKTYVDECSLRCKLKMEMVLKIAKVILHVNKRHTRILRAMPKFQNGQTTFYLRIFQMMNEKRQGYEELCRHHNIDIAVLPFFIDSRY